MSQGFIPLYRKMLDEWFWKNLNTGHLMNTLLLLANHKKVTIPFEGRKRIINRGEFITTHRDLADFAGMSKSTLKRTLGTLINEEEVELIPTRATHIRIIRYNYFMTGSLDQGWTKDEPLVVLNNNDNNDKNDIYNSTDIKSVNEVISEIMEDEIFTSEVKKKFSLNNHSLEGEIDHMYNNYLEKNKTTYNWKASLKSWLYNGQKIEKNYVEKAFAESDAYDNPE